MSKDKSVIAIALVLIFSMITCTTLMVSVQGQGEGIEIPTYAHVNIAPNPAGIGQTCSLNFFLTKPPPTAWMGGAGDVYENMIIEVVDPSGNEETLGPYYSDPTGGSFTTFVPDEVGEYTFQLFYEGQILTGDNPYYPYPPRTHSLIGAAMLPSESEIVTLVVQEEPVMPLYKTPPLPAEYWSRPIYATNWDWGQLGGNWFGLDSPSFADTGMYDTTGNFQPYTTAPNTPHILWTKPNGFGGQVGAPFNSDQESQYTSTSILVRHWEPIIIYGILYYESNPSPSRATSDWTAVDLRTGETLWTRSRGEDGNERLKMGQAIKFHSLQQYGSYALLYAIASNPTRFTIYEPTTGKYMAEILDISPIAGFFSTGDFLMDFDCNEQGTLLAWYTSGGNLTMWNSTQLFAYPNGFQGTPNYGTLTPSGTYNFEYGTMAPGGWSVPIVDPSLGIAARTPEVILFRSAPTISSGVSSGYQVTAGYEAKTGSLLWGPLNQTIPAQQDVSIVAARDGYYVLHNKDSNDAYGYSLETGEKLWGPVRLPGNAWSSIERGGEIAYGKVYIWDWGGYVNALDLETGEIEWTFTRGSSGYDTPLGVYPIWHFGTHSICDGKIFLSEGGMYNPPLHPAKRLAINCTTGDLVWSILSFSGRAPAAHADGMMAQWNSFDKQIYSFGKGPSATTVTVGPEISVHGNKVLVKGMVTDESAGTKDSDRIARFPDGVPAVSDESMTEWMEYVYMQQPKPANTTGVEVTVSVLDPNGNSYDVGTTTSDDNGFYKLMFTPLVPGEYSIHAAFKGSESYWPSAAVTAIYVEEAPQATPEPTSQPGSAADLYFLPMSIGTIVAVIVIGLLLFLMIRKR